jgi:uncharacterized protein (DUF1697 family)
VPTVVLLLRAVNVGGVRIAKADLRRVASALGLSDVRTHLNSGNLLAESEGPPDAVAGALAAKLGAEVPVIARTPEALAAALAACPFGPPEIEPAKVQFAFLDALPAVEGLDWDGPERVAVAGTEAFIHYPDGVGRSELTLARLERGLGVTATMRGAKTVTGLLDRC